MTERESQLMDMLRRMCDAMKCKDCPLWIEGDIHELIVEGGPCELAELIVHTGVEQ